MILVAVTGTSSLRRWLSPHHDPLRLGDLAVTGYSFSTLRYLGRN
jgi:hypothetical protein